MPSENSNTQYLVTKGELDEVAAAIQEKAGLTQKLHWPHEMASAIREIETENTGSNFDFSGVNVTSDKMLTGTTAWNNQGSMINGNIDFIPESLYNGVQTSPNDITLSSNSVDVIMGQNYLSGFYSTTHFPSLNYDGSWEITPSIEDKTYYLLNTSSFSYRSQPNQPTGFNSWAFPYAITVKSMPTSIDWTGGGSINITAKTALEGTYFYNNSGSIQQGNIPIQQIVSIGAYETIRPADINNNNNITNEVITYPSGYYAGQHGFNLQAASRTQSSVISIIPSSTSQTITLIGPSATYDYFPNAITIASVSNGNSVTDWTGNGTINITSDKVLNNTYFYNTSGSIQQGTIPIRQSTSNITRATVTPGDIDDNGNLMGLATFSSGYYAGRHGFGLQTASNTQSSIISISPSSTSQTVTLFGGDCTYDYFPYAITVASVTGEASSELREQTWIESGFSNITNSLVTTIRSRAFYYDPVIITVSFPMCYYIGAYAFQSCFNLTSINFPNCETIESYTFNNCSNLTSINFPNCETIGSYAFQQCSKLTSINFSNCTTIESYAFRNCFNLESINLPACTSLGRQAFYNCRNLKNITMLGSSIQSSAFYSCFNLMNLTLTASTVVQLLDSNVFNSTPITGYRNTSYYTGPEGGFGSIYVPASLYNSYIIAPYWSLISSRIVAIQ